MYSNINKNVRSEKNKGRKEDKTEDYEWLGLPV
jgi:hypothetical protein